MRAHARELGVGQPSRILATGGGSKNREVRWSGKRLELGLGGDR